MREGLVPPITVYVDGLARDVSTIYEKLLNRSLFNYYVQPAPTYQGFSFEEACRENLREADCILSTSGMLVEGTPSFIYSKLLAKDSRSSIIFSGYMAEESFGYKLLNSKEFLSAFRCKVEKHHLSAHSDRTELEEILETLNPGKTYFIHGYPTGEARKYHVFNREVVRF